MPIAQVVEEVQRQADHDDRSERTAGHAGEGSEGFRTGGDGGEPQDDDEATDGIEDAGDTMQDGRNHLHLPLVDLEMR